MRNFVRAQSCLSSRAIINAKERGKGGEGEVKEDKDSKRADEQRRFCRLFIEVTQYSEESWQLVYARRAR